MKSRSLTCVLVVLSTMGCWACSGTPAMRPAALSSAQPLYISGVPFFPQLEAQCGPASLAAVLNYWGEPVSPDEIAREIYVPRLRGSLSLDLWRYAQGKQFDAAIHRGSLEYLQSHLMLNEPIVASLNLGYRLVPLGHFLVVVGLDPNEGTVITYSGTEKNSRIPFDKFLSAWEKTGYWALLVKPKAPTGGGGIESGRADRSHPARRSCASPHYR
jgi:ABC-type bacteriocin/lantibiotic exporter with double-glycine peptidase domain